MSSTANQSHRPAPRRFWILVLLTAVGVGLLIYSVYGTRQRTPLRVGQPSPQTFVAPVATQVEDELATHRERIAAREQIETVYTSDPRMTSLVTAGITSSGLPPVVVDAIVNTYRQPAGVRAEVIPVLIEDMLRLVPPERQRETRLTLERYLEATSVPNDRLTQAARDAAFNAVPPVLQSLEAGQVIVAEGEPLTEDQLRVLGSLGLYSARAEAISQTAWIVTGVVILTLLLVAPLVFLRGTLLARLTFRKVAFLLVITLLVLLLQRIATLASPHFLFALLAPLVVAALLGSRAGILLGAWVAFAMGVLVPSSAVIALVATLVGSTSAALVAASSRNRLWLILAGVVGGLAGGVSLVGMVLLAGGMTLGAAVTGALLLTGGGLLAGVLTLGLLPVAESGFGFLTDFRLIELSSPTHPLLQRLIAEAPGTYQHSLIISNLVEQAVKNVGGNALLARVGALYHDIGKMRRPQFFVENQFTGENPHDRISPHLSYLIITSHVRDGLELLRANDMPEELEPYVAEHHGTTVLSYFYKRALEEGQVEELNFRYPGPRPSSKESAILMLADAVESASRTLSDPSPSSIRALIDRLIQQRRQDGQLDEAPLTFQDLEVIASTFERMLTAILHRRISYPSAEEVRSLKRVRAAQSDAYSSPSAETKAAGAKRKEAATEAKGKDGTDRATGRDGALPVR